MEIAQIQTLLDEKLPKCEVTVDGDGYHHHVLVVGDVFEGLNRVKRQQLIYAILNEHIVSGELHAINMKTMTPAERDAASS